MLKPVIHVSKRQCMYPTDWAHTAPKRAPMTTYVPVMHFMQREDFQHIGHGRLPRANIHRAHALLWLFLSVYKNKGAHSPAKCHVVGAQDISFYHVLNGLTQTKRGWHGPITIGVSGSSSHSLFIIWVETYFVFCWNQVPRMRGEKKICTHHPHGWRSWNHSISGCIFGRGRPVEVSQMPHVPWFQWNIFNCDNIWWDWPGIGSAQTHSPFSASDTTWRFLLNVSWI